MAGARVDGDAASAMERLRLHLAARPQRHRARAICAWRRGGGRPGSTSPFYALMQRARAGEDKPRSAPAHRNGPRSERDFPILEEFFALGRHGLPGATLRLRRGGDRSQGTGIVYSFTTDRKGGFSDDDATLVQATLPALVAGDEGPCRPCHRLRLAWRLSRRGRRTARPCRLDHARFGRQSARGDLVRRHSRLHAAQRRGAGSRRRRTAQRRVRDPDRVAARARRAGAQVHRRRHARHLPVRGGGPRRRRAAARSTPRSRRCATSRRSTRRAQRRARRSPPSISRSILATCSTAMSARSTGSISRSSARRSTRSARIEALCEPLGRAVLVSAEFVAGMTAADARLKSLGRHALRGVKEPKEIFALDLGAAPA